MSSDSIDIECTVYKTVRHIEGPTEKEESPQVLKFSVVIMYATFYVWRKSAHRKYHDMQLTSSL